MEPRLIRTKTYVNLSNQMIGTRETKIKRQRRKSMEFRWLPELDIVLDEPIDFSKRYNMEDEGHRAGYIVADNGIEPSKESAQTLKCGPKHWSEGTGQTIHSYNTGVTTRFKTMPLDFGHVKENKPVGLIGNPRTMNQINVKLKMPKMNQHAGSTTKTNLSVR
ncbi:hypothetical protein AHF37_03245 [Paragonimus kellicotti]|nr:hypothetical protein AHF37_03245 [Paragonimus kellicotti]